MELAALPMTLLMIALLTHLHLRRPQPPSAPDFAPAWLLPELKGEQAQGARRLSQPLLWLTRLLCLLALLCAPLSWRPWQQLLQGAQRPEGLLLLSDTPHISPDERWPEPTWVALIDSCRAELLHLTPLTSLSSQQGQERQERQERQEQQEQQERQTLTQRARCALGALERERLISEALSSLLERAPMPLELAWLTPETPRLRFARAQWVDQAPRGSTRRVTPAERALRVELQLGPRDEVTQTSASAHTLRALITQGASLRVLLSAPLSDHHGLFTRTLTLNGADTEALSQGASLRVELLSERGALLDALPIALPPHHLTAFGAWPKALTPLFELLKIDQAPLAALQGDAQGADTSAQQAPERRAEALMSWCALPCEGALERDLLRRCDRLFVFEEGEDEGAEAPLWGARLAEGELGRVRRWRDLNKSPLSAPNSSCGALHELLRDLELPERSLQARHAHLWAPLKGEALTPSAWRGELAAVLDEVPLEVEPLDTSLGSAHTLTLTRLGWRPQGAIEELAPLLSLMRSWQLKRLSRVSLHPHLSLAPHATAPAHLSEPHEPSEATLAALTLSPYKAQHLEPLARPRAFDQITQGRQSPRWLLGLASSALALLIARLSPWALLTLSLSSLALLSYAERSRGLWGLWRSQPLVSITPALNSADDPQRHAHVEALRRAWRERLTARGFRLYDDPQELDHPQELEQCRGPQLISSPLHAQGQQRSSPHVWCLHVPSPARPQLKLAEVEEVPSLEGGRWLKASLTPSDPSGPLAELAADQGLYRLTFEAQGAPNSPPLELVSCQGAACLSARPMVHLSAPLDERPAAFIAPRQLKLWWRATEGDEPRLAQELTWSPAAPTSPPLAWVWSRELSATLQEVGFDVQRTPKQLSELSRPLPERLKLIVLPHQQLTRLSPSELDQLIAWLRRGGQLFLTHSTQDERSLTLSHELSPLNDRPPPLDRARLILLIDTSGSVAREAGGRGVSELIQEGLSLASALYPRDEVALITFAGEASLNLAPTERSRLRAVSAPQRGRGGSRVSAALQEASAWLSKSGPQRWLLITDGELSSEGLEAVSERLSLLSQRADLSLGVALTSDAPLSASANTTLKALKALTPLTIASLSAWHKGGLLSWRQARSRSSQRATPHKSSPDEGLPPQLAEDGAARRLGLTRDDQPALPLAYGVARKGLKQGAQALLEVLAPQPYAPSAEHSTQEAAPLERRPLLVERPLGLGRVVELNASRWPLSAQLLRRLFVRSQPLIMTPWSFAWSSSQSSSPSAQPQGAQLLAYKPLSMDEPLPLIAHAWLSAPPPSLRLISGAWRPVLSNLSVFSAYDEADAVELPHNQDEDPPRFFELTTAHNTHPGLEPARLKLPLTLPQRFERPPLLHPADLKAHTSTLHREGRWLSVEESAAPSGELLDELSASASEPTPLPSELMWWLALLCLALELARSTQTYKDA